MIKLVVTNQKGGVAKTTTCLNLARYFADLGKRVLIVDTDPQGHISQNIGYARNQINAYLGDLLVRNCKPEACILNVRERIDIIASDRSTMQAEGLLLSAPARESAFRHVFEDFDEAYDVVLLDTSPTITVMQTCALVYAQWFITPVTMDNLSIHGAVALIEMAGLMNELYKRVDVRGLAFLPVMVDRRLGMTYEANDALQQTAQKYGMHILPGIRTDQAVVRTNSKKRGFLADFEARSKAWEDYRAAGARLMEILNGQLIQPTSAEAAV